MKSRNKTKLLCILGPTGIGKTALALAVAKQCNGAIINIDSRQAYADFPIITAQPPAVQRSECPHYLYGFLATEEKFSVGIFIEKIHTIIASVVKKGQTPLLVGGTGMYIRALLHGIADIPPVPASLSLSLKAAYACKGAPFLHGILQEHDPRAAMRIHPNDRQRIMRALEVWMGTGHSLSWWHEHSNINTPYEALKLGLQASLADLAPRLDARIEAMLALGALEEIGRAYEVCPDRTAPGWSGIGCRELLRYWLGEEPLDEACRRWRTNTRAYAKRQLTWFAKEPEICWLPEKIDERKVMEKIMTFLEKS